MDTSKILKEIKKDKEFFKRRVNLFKEHIDKYWIRFIYIVNRLENASASTDYREFYERELEILPQVKKITYRTQLFKMFLVNINPEFSEIEKDNIILLFLSKDENDRELGLQIVLNYIEKL